MADRSKFEAMLELLVNEDKEGAEALFHEIVVEKSRDIYESLLEDEEVEETTDEEVDEATDEEVDEAVTPKSDREQMREYVDKVASGHGAEKKSTGDNGDSGKSPVASANNMGGTSANIVKGGEAGSGDHAGLGELNAKDQDGGNINVPGGKASKAGKSEPGHGAEKKGKPEAADNKKSVVGK